MIVLAVGDWDLITTIGINALTRNREDVKALAGLLAALGIKKDIEGAEREFSYVEFEPESIRLDVSYGARPGHPEDLWLRVDDPETAYGVIKRLGYTVFDRPPALKANAKDFKSFGVKLPGGTTLGIFGFTHPLLRKSKQAVNLRGHLLAKGKKFCVVASVFNSFITNRLVDGAVDALLRTGAEMPFVLQVPGAFEIPLAARKAAETKKYDAIICIGCLLRGDTAHYDVIVNEVTRGIGQSAQETGVPHAFGVLTCDTLEQAIDRAGLKMGNKGFEAALAAIEMANLTKFVSEALHGRKKGPTSKASGVRKGKTTDN